MVSSVALLIGAFCSLAVSNASAGVDPRAGMEGQDVRYYLRGHRRARLEQSESTVMPQDTVEGTLESQFIDTLGMVSTDALWKMLGVPAEIEATMRQTYNAMPKNQHGRLSYHGVRQMLARWFLSEHGWSIHGLELDHKQLKPLKIFSEMLSLTKKVQAKEWKLTVPVAEPMALENQMNDTRALGFTLKNVATLAAMLEQFIFFEGEEILEQAFAVFGLDTRGTVSHAGLAHVLAVYIMFIRHGFIRTPVIPLDEDLAAVSRRVGSMAANIILCSDAINTVAFAEKDTRNPFVGPPRYGFHDALAMLGPVSRAFGLEQKGECLAMKATLLDMNPVAGMIPLRTFWNTPTREGGGGFSESFDYLSAMGALGTLQSGGADMVRMTNYIYGPSNCFGESVFFSLCCADECEAVLRTFEEEVAGPLAAPEHVLQIAGNLSTDTRPHSHAVEPYLAEKLYEIADRHDGQVVLHGRLFAQWLHHVFPNECKFPAIVADSNATTPSYWGLHGRGFGPRTVSQKVQEPTIWKANESEKQVVLETLRETSNETAHLAPWLDEEILPFPYEPASTSRRAATAIFYLALAGAMAFSVLRFTYQAGQSFLAIPPARRKSSLPSLPSVDDEIARREKRCPM